ncbi:hypothetical protein F5Y03DRAFT_55374 [Xylaria venustula]|nr:hypothetical protein F5Y03DRAFT_55374 [Xylaria venustula]
MPVVSLPVQQTHSITRSVFIPPEEAQLLLSFAAAFVGPIALLVLFVSWSRKYKTSPHPVPLQAHSMRTTREQSLKQLRELSIGRIIMPASRKSEKSSSGAHKTHDKDGRGGKRGESRSPSSKAKHQEELEMYKAIMDEGRKLKPQPSPMPLTPPEGSTRFSNFQNRRSSVAASTHNDFDPTLTYGMAWDIPSPESTTSIAPHVRTSSPLRYTTTLSYDTAHPNSSTEPELDDASSAFAPSSFPSSSQILPIAPHAVLHSTEYGVAGDMLSATGDSGAGWQRHTRVYGGGVCLACLAAGDEEGGFYGENVPLDQRR